MTQNEIPTREKHLDWTSIVIIPILQSLLLDQEEHY